MHCLTKHARVGNGDSIHMAYNDRKSFNSLEFVLRFHLCTVRHWNTVIALLGLNDRREIRCPSDTPDKMLHCVMHGLLVLFTLTDIGKQHRDR
jgi:hypothetical protein